MWLLIDDCRDLGCEVIARNGTVAKLILQTPGLFFDCVCFDHDLGTKETGYDVLKWALTHRCLTNRVQLVTSNPVGKENMANLLRDNGYTSRDNTDFFKE